MKVRKLRELILCLSLTLIGSIVWTEALLSQRNILAFKKDWRLATLDFMNPAIVSVPIYVSPLVLQGHRLKSTPELGLIRLLSESPSVPTEAKLWFRLRDNGFVELIFNSGKNTHQSLRISRSKYFPSALIRSSSSEKYEEVHPLNLHPGEGFHSAVIRNETLELDGKEFRVPGLRFQDGQTGVQISPAHAEVFALKITGQESSQFLHFFPDGDRLPLYGRHWVVLLALVFVLGLLPRMRRDKLSLFAAGTGVLFLFSDVLIGIDRERTPQELRKKFEVMDHLWRPGGEVTLEEKLKGLKKDDADSAIFLCRQSGCEKTRLRTLEPKRNERILIFGGSQSKYGLIRNYEESFHFQLDRVLREGKPHVETINLSTPGFFRDRLSAYGPSLENIAPDIVIIETLAMKEDRPHLRTFLEETRKKGVRTILLRTPQNLLNFNDAEVPIVMAEIRKGLRSRPTELPEINKWLALNNLDFIRDAQKELGLVFLDPNGVFLQEKVLTSGQLFWDATHLSIHGQKILADWLGKEILKLD